MGRSNWVRFAYLGRGAELGLFCAFGARRAVPVREISGLGGNLGSFRTMWGGQRHGGRGLGFGSHNWVVGRV